MFTIIQAAGWPIWPLIACSVVGLALVVERFLSLRVARVAPPKLLDEAIAVSLKAVPPPQVLQQLAQNSVLGELLAAGLQQLHQKPASTEAELRTSLEAAGRFAAAKLEKHLGALATIASVAPLIGLLGTVVGMIEIFASQAGPGGGNPEQLAHGISIALYSTAFGLIIAIPALMFWRYFRARNEAWLLQMEVAAERFAQHLLTLRRP